MPCRTGSCATSTSPRTRRSRRCSPSGETFPSSATRRASTPGRTGSSCAPATPRVAGPASWAPNLRLLPADEPTGADDHELGRRSRPARARLPPAVHRPSRGGGAAPLPRHAARRDRRDPRHPVGTAQIPTTSRDARAARGARRRRPTCQRRRLRNEHRSGHHAHRSVVASEEEHGLAGPRPRHRARPSLDATPQRRLLVAGAEVRPHEHLREAGDCRRGRRGRRGRRLQPLAKSRRDRRRPADPNAARRARPPYHRSRAGRWRPGPIP